MGVAWVVLGSHLGELGRNGTVKREFGWGLGGALRRLGEGAALAAQYGLHVAAGHGLTTRNILAVAAIGEITEFNIGHHIVARAVFVGLESAVREMREAIRMGSAGN